MPRTRNKPKKQRARRTSDWRPAFLAAFSLTGVVLSACEAVPIHISTVMLEKKVNSTFAAGYEAARIAGAHTLEKEAVRRATQGVRKLKFFEGQMIMIPSGNMIENEDGTRRPEMVPYVEHEYSDTLLALLLKRHFPADYREKPPEVSVTSNTNVSVVISADQLATYQAREKQALEALMNGRN